MKIKYQINKTYPEVQYLARIVDLPMATFNPELTESKVTKERLPRKGITVTEDKELKINIFILFWYLLNGYNLLSITERKTGQMYTFNHELVHLSRS